MAGVVSKTVAKEVERYHCKVCGHNWEGRPYRWKVLIEIVLSSVLSVVLVTGGSDGRKCSGFKDRVDSDYGWREGSSKT